ncbi:MAG: YihY family inner membrane protein [Geobacteraceae bacterium]|nr:YihY family inner membrane protein [Geobacteraceae bacterium]
MNVINPIIHYFSKGVWEPDPEDYRGLQRFWLIVIQFISIVVRNSWRNQWFLRSSSLAFTSLLALVPFLAIIFSILKGLGVQNQVAPALLEQLSAGSQDVAARIIRYIDNTNMTSLGGFGLAGLLVTVVMLLDSVEESFNQIWIVKETRPLGKKIGGQLILLISMPALIFAALSLTTFLEGQAAFNWFLTSASLGEILPDILHFLPYLMVCIALTFLYKIVPNTVVSSGSALIGAFLAGTLWQLAQRFYVHFQFGVARNNAIYGTMAALPTFMIWIYVSWLIVLLGVEIVHAHQNIRTIRRELKVGPVSQRVRELLSLAILQDISTLSGSRVKGWTGEHLGDAFDLPEKILKELLSSLMLQGFIISTDDAPPVYALAKEPEEIMVSEVLSALQNSPVGWQPLTMTKGESYLADLLARVDTCMAKSLSGISLRDLADEVPRNESSSPH